MNIMKQLLFFLLLITQSFAKQPNIIFILTDDQGYGDIARHGHPLLDTPHLDALWDESVKFDNFYVSPSCSPTRAALMTGMHEFMSGVTHTIIPREHMSQEMTTLPTLLRDAGYKTGFVGKWHLGGGVGFSPNFRGFQWMSTNVGGPHQHFDVQMRRNGKLHQTAGYREDQFCNEGMEFIKEAGDNPFFLYLATYSPHAPYDAPADLVEKYAAKGVTDKQAKYLGMIENIDMNIGRLRQYLVDTGKAQDTILIAMNDNGITEGLDIYNANMRGCKCTAWQGGTRAFSLWNWPTHWEPALIKEELTAHLDVLPTLCQLAGVDLPESLLPQLEGKSLVPLLEGRKSPWHEKRILYHNVARWTSGYAQYHKNHNCGVRQGDYLLLRSSHCGQPGCRIKFSPCALLKLIEQGQKSAHYTEGNAQHHWGVSGPEWELYNVKSDPANQHNLAESHPDLVHTLSSSYNQWWEGMYDTMIARGGDATKAE